MRCASMAKPDPDLSRDFKRNFVIAELLSGRIKMIYHDPDLRRQVAPKVNQPKILKFEESGYGFAQSAILV